MEKSVTCYTAGNMPGAHTLIPEGFGHTDTLRAIAASCDTPWLLLYTKPYELKLGANALERFLAIAADTGAAWLYSDYNEAKEGKTTRHPLIDYRPGSLRDDFNFGSVLFLNTNRFKEAVRNMDTDYRFAALYDLRLKISLSGMILRIPEFLYTETETDLRLSGAKQFDYVNPRNREVQIEMEQACTHYLKESGAWLPPPNREIDFPGEFPVEASVVIPVKNRENTISDAVTSALNQKCDFPFNVLVVDNHSDDHTSTILQKAAENDPRLIHIVPERNDLGIGGCWNLAVSDNRCGRFCIQLDSDDLYADTDILQRIVHTFRTEKSAAVIGSYRMVDFELRSIPPGLIDHREWTPENGHNNALRINGFGAPRAFYTPVVRTLKFPNTNYGEDYATVLALSGEYKIGRIYDPLYLCRRWSGNSDAALSVEQENTNNSYKDTIRTIEWIARKNRNAQNLPE